MVDVPVEQRPEELEEGLWTSFQQAGSDHEYYESWLALQAGYVRGAVCAQLMVHRGENRFAVVAKWPERQGLDERLEGLARKVIADQCGLLEETDEPGRYDLAYPLLIEDAVESVVTFEVVAGDERALQAVMEQLQWGVSWLEVLMRRHRWREDNLLLAKLQAGVDILAVTLNEESFLGAAMVLAAETAAAVDCERVSIGLLHGRRLKLHAVSHSSDVDQKMALTRLIEGAMEEAVFQQSEIRYPPPEESKEICREHEALSRQQAMAAVVTLPLMQHDMVLGAITCERGADRPFSQEDCEFLTGIAGLAGPALITQFQNDWPLPAKIGRAFADSLGMLLGASHLALKLVLLCVAGLVVALYSLTMEYRLGADTILEGAIQRSVVVPFDGYINEAPVRAGDLVHEGDLLCALDSRDLTLEKVAKFSQFRQSERQYQDAIAQHDRSRASILKAKLAQSQAEIDLLDAQLARTKLTAPFSGLVVTGDLSQRLGSAVEQGEVLFQVAPLNEYRVILKVDERRVSDVTVGQHGELVLSSLPNLVYPFTVTKLTPFTVAEEGRNYFRVEARLDEVDGRVRPGMEGVGKVSVDRRRAVSIWTRDFVEWIRLFTWKWMP